ncbi:hypothetical protein SAMN05216378_0616 [Paenibacillus catalpae]|uniref:Uncharacterized protein n=1 Tax=Paenibacillus catalpae TaxID=1045775 RepID=A0A1I1TPK9_9BACL|nr:hypothetical protein [Paenibacillus catalpae]SFD60497.1 hypothetical protein SAMN05216378_0616 [Paenibacillus catalpae]
MSDNSCGNKTYGTKSVFTLLSTLPIGTAINIHVSGSIHDGTWAGFTDGIATVTSSFDNKTEYIPLNQITAVYVL